MGKTRKTHELRLRCEQLEDRALPVTAVLSGSSLIIDGTPAADTIVVRQDGTRISIDGVLIRDGGHAITAIEASRIHRVVVRGAAGNDTIHLGSLRLDAMIWGGSGDDRIYAGSGNDIIYGDQGNDSIWGASGNDWLVGGDGDDQIWGGSGHDWISGDNGDDRLFGDHGDDTISGGEGRDFLSGGAGVDLLDGHGYGMGAMTSTRNFDTYQDDFDLWRPLPARSKPPLLKGEIDEPGFLAVLGAISEKDLAANIRVVARGVYDVYLPGDRRTVRVLFDGTWTDNDPKPTPEAVPSFALILLSRARLQSFGFDPAQYRTPAEWAAANAQTGGRLFDPLNALRQFTGRAVSWLSPGSIDFQWLRQRLSDGAAVVAVAPSAAKRQANADGIMTGVAYSVERVFTDHLGRSWVELSNPLGTDRGDGRLVDDAPGALRRDDGVITISWDTFRKWTNFQSVLLA